MSLITLYIQRTPISNTFEPPLGQDTTKEVRENIGPIVGLAEVGHSRKT